MKLSVLSGKGGTGKTLITVNLASVAEDSVYIDCDVEEPNAYLFFEPKSFKEDIVAVKSPRVDINLCSACKKCLEFCNFNALAYIKDKLLVFQELCHSCGACSILCPDKAITETDRPIGRVMVCQTSPKAPVSLYTGFLDPGEASGVPIINRLFDEAKNEADKDIFIDCPPGSSCLVMDSIKEADYCILVAEPTIFGVHNLAMVYDLVRLLKKPHGVVLNKCVEGENPVEAFCQDRGIKVLARIPFDKKLGEISSNAGIAALEDKKYHEFFLSLLRIVKEELGCERATYPKR